MEQIKFSNNWNNKLTNKAFTTIRIHNPSKYRLYEKYNIDLKGELCGVAELIGIRTLRIDQLNEFICYLDTGYSIEETKEIFKRMYPNLNLESAKFDFCLLVYVKYEPTAAG